MFQLCLALGVPHPRYLARYLTVSDLADWVAYSIVEPFGERRADLRAGMVVSATAGKIAPTEVFPDFDLEEYLRMQRAREEMTDEKRTKMDIAALESMGITVLRPGDFDGFA